MSDSAWEIRNGFLAVWPDKDLTNCFAHVMMNCDKRMKTEVPDEKERKKIKSDICTLQLCQSEDIFLKAAELFIKKYEVKYNTFTMYFRQQHVNQFPNWYEGKAMFAPSTNNALESRNGKVKQLWTNHRRLPMNEMIVLVDKMINDWSLDLVQNPFVEAPIYTEDEIIDAYIYAKKNVEVLEDPDNSSDDEYKVWWVAEDETKTITSRMIRNVKMMNYNNFEKFKEVNFSVLKIQTNEKHESSTIPAMCNCRNFYKSFKCVHALGTAIRLKKFVVERKLKVEAKKKVESAVPMPAKKRGPGRPKNATRALMKD